LLFPNEIEKEKITPSELFQKGVVWTKYLRCHYSDFGHWHFPFFHCVWSFA